MGVTVLSKMSVREGEEGMTVHSLVQHLGDTK